MRETLSQGEHYKMFFYILDFGLYPKAIEHYRFYLSVT